MHVLILGSTGFVGSRIARRFSCDANFSIEAYSSKECDLTHKDSIDFLKAKIQQNTCIFFCSTIARLKEDSLNSFHKNVAMAENVARAVGEAPPSNLIFCSSIDVYGRPPTETPIREGSPLNPAGYYGLSKFVSERILLNEIPETTPVAILRLPGVYSLDENDNSVLGQMFHSIRKNAHINLSGGGQQKRSYLHILELESILRYIIMNRWSGIMNSCISSNVSIYDTALSMKKFLDSHSEIRAVDKDGSEFDICFDNSFLKSIIPDLKAMSLEHYMDQAVGTVV
ncbi:MAG: NAD(P)-dependent oxidoreductase [Pseudomonadota bacterium]